MGDMVEMLGQECTNNYAEGKLPINGSEDVSKLFNPTTCLCLPVRLVWL